MFVYAKFQLTFYDYIYTRYYVHTLIDIHTEIVLLHMWTGIKEIKMDLLYQYTERYSALFYPVIVSFIHIHIFIDVVLHRKKCKC